MIDFEQDRYMVLSKDKEKLLSYVGFKNTKDYKHNDANPMLFMSKAVAKNYIKKNFNHLINDIIFLKVKAVYVEYE